jgi:hypothetical protein
MAYIPLLERQNGNRLAGAHGVLPRHFSCVVLMCGLTLKMAVERAVESSVSGGVARFFAFAAYVVVTRPRRSTSEMLPQVGDTPDHPYPCLSSGDAGHDQYMPLFQIIHAINLLLEF